MSLIWSIPSMMDLGHVQDRADPGPAAGLFLMCYLVVCTRRPFCCSDNCMSLKFDLWAILPDWLTWAMNYLFIPTGPLGSPGCIGAVPESKCLQTHRAWWQTPLLQDGLSCGEEGFVWAHVLLMFWRPCFLCVDWLIDWLIDWLVDWLQIDCGARPGMLLDEYISGGKGTCAPPTPHVIMLL